MAMPTESESSDAEDTDSDSYWLDPITPEEVIDAKLRELGFDPAELRAKGERFAREEIPRIRARRKAMAWWGVGLLCGYEDKGGGK